MDAKLEYLPKFIERIYVDDEDFSYIPVIAGVEPSLNAYALTCIATSKGYQIGYSHLSRLEWAELNSTVLVEAETLNSAITQMHKLLEQESKKSDEKIFSFITTVNYANA